MNIHSVNDVTKYIKNLLSDEHNLQDIFVRGEISNFKKYPSGHCYFILKDNCACLKCVMFQSEAKKIKFLPTNGLKVIAQGYVSVYERDSVYQLYTSNIIPEGVGELSVLYDQLKEKLTSEGIFSDEHKKALPQFPKKIGIVTSQSGAVLHDIFKIAKRRNPNIKLILYPANVQGNGSAEQIVEGINFFNKDYPVDVLIIGRGGGSKEDLWSFNEEIVVRAVYNSQIPLISAVGHETDFSLSDFAADVRAATPSHAAELAVPEIFSILNRVNELKIKLDFLKNNIIANKRKKLLNCNSNTILKILHEKLNSNKHSITLLNERLIRLRNQHLSRKKQQSLFQINRIELLNPIRTLKRGFGIIEKNDCILHSVANVQFGDVIQITLSDGKIISKVEQTKKGEFILDG